jgi:hypothetical protein
VNALAITLLQNIRMTEMTLPLRRLLGQDVALEGVAVLDTTLARELEALHGAPIRLHFRHFTISALGLCRSLRCDESAH